MLLINLAFICYLFALKYSTLNKNFVISYIKLCLAYGFCVVNWDGILKVFVIYWLMFNKSSHHSVVFNIKHLFKKNYYFSPTNAYK